MIEDKEARHAAYEDIFSNGGFISFTGDQLDSLRARYESGQGIYTLSESFGIDPCAVRRRLLAIGVTMRRSGRQPLFSDDQCAAMLDEKNKTGESNRAMAKRYGCSSKAIADNLNRARIREYAKA